MNKQVVKEQLYTELHKFLAANKATYQFNQALLLRSEYNSAAQFVSRFVDERRPFEDLLARVFVWGSKDQKNKYWPNMSHKWRKYVRKGFNLTKNESFKSIW